MTISFTHSDRSVTFFHPATFTSTAVDASHPNFDVIRDAVLAGAPDSDYDSLVELASPVQALQTKLAPAFDALTDEIADLPAGIVAVNRNGVTYNDEPVHGVLVDMILAIFAEGGNFLPWVRFLTNVRRNPFTESAEELYEWLVKANMPILPDGRFLAYKRVNADYTSCYDNKTMNAIGTVVVMPGGRAAVDADRRRTCSAGLHFCSHSYLPHFGTHSVARTLLLAIDPADVVSIPTDYDHAKGRAYQYEVIGEIDHDDAVSREWDTVWTPPADSTYSGDDAVDDDDDQDEDVEYDNDYSDEDFADVLSEAALLLQKHGWRLTKSATSSGFTVEQAVRQAAATNGIDPDTVADEAFDKFASDYTFSSWNELNDVVMRGDRRKAIRALRRYAV